MCDACSAAGAASFAAAQVRTVPLAGYTCYVAVAAGHIACIHTVMSAISADDKRATRWFHHTYCTVDCDNLEALQALCAYGVFAAHDDTARATLYKAVTLDRAGIVSYLLDVGVPMDVSTFYGTVKGGALECLKMLDARGLLRGGAMCDFESDAHVFHAIISMATVCGNIAIVQWAYERGAEFTDEDFVFAMNYRSQLRETDYLMQPNWDAVVAFYAEHGIAAAQQQLP